MTALKAMTIWPAYQHFEEHSKGSLELGKLADFVILSKDPTAIDPETLHQVEVTETVKNGKVIYRQSDVSDTAARASTAAAGEVFGRVLSQWQHSNEERGLSDHSHGPELLMAAMLEGLESSQADVKQ